MSNMKFIPMIVFIICSKALPFQQTKSNPQNLEKGRVKGPTFGPFD